MEEHKRLDKNLEDKLDEYIKSNYPEIESYEYTISPDGTIFKLIFRYEFADSDQILNDINIIEELLDVKFISIESVNGVTSFINKFNK